MQEHGLPYAFYLISADLVSLTATSGPNVKHPEPHVLRLNYNDFFVREATRGIRTQEDN